MKIIIILTSLLFVSCSEDFIREVVRGERCYTYLPENVSEVTLFCKEQVCKNALVDYARVECLSKKIECKCSDGTIYIPTNIKVRTRQY